MADLGHDPGVDHLPEEVDGRLMRYLDAEVSASSGSETLALLEASPEARKRLEELRAASDLLSDHLAEIEVPSPPELTFPGSWEHRFRPGFLSFFSHNRVAAAVILLLLSLSLLTPVGAWIVNGIRSVASSILFPEPPAVGPTGAEVGASIVRFVPTGDELLVSVLVRQASGRLRVAVVEGPRASGQALDPEAGIELLVLPRGLEVRNRPTAVAEYSVEVPRSMRSVRIQVGGRDVAVLAPGEVEVGHAWIFELSQSGG